ncbi:MAG: hypothetical protein ACR2QW_14985 [bacterium]
MNHLIFPLRRLLHKPFIPGILAGLVLGAVYLYLFAFKAHVELEIKMFEPTRAWFKIYWAEDNADFTEKNMQQVLINGTHEKYSLYIGNLGSIQRLRIDPVEFKTKLYLKKLSITQPGYTPIMLSPENRFNGLKPVKQIDRVAVKEGGLRFYTTGRDGQFHYIVDKSKAGEFAIVHLAVLLCILVLCVLVARILNPLQKDLNFVPVLMVVALTLSFIMAVVSKHYWLHPDGTSRIFVHPDEEAHVEAVEYYSHHLIPPELEAEEIQSSYSVYGYTRLASYELYYPIAGFLSRLLEPFKQTPIWDARLVGVFLFGLLSLFASLHQPFRPFVLPFLITPQVWYLFSYTNSDGFALALTTIAAYQAAYKGSTLNKVLSERSPAGLWFDLCWLGCLLGGLLLLKLNFYFFILFLGCYLVWRMVLGDFPDQKRLWMRLVMIAMIGLGLYGSRIGLDMAVNGPDTKQKQLELVEKMAEPLYKPSTPLSKKHIYLYMRDRGFSLERIINKEQWGGKTFISSFGAYGFTQYLGGSVYYAAVRIIGLAMIGLVLFSILIYGPASTHWLFAITFGCASMLVAASLWQSWNISFQAQGRYMAPILPMLGILYFHTRPWLMNRTFNGLVFTMFALGAYSFIFIGLTLIPKFP